MMKRSLNKILDDYLNNTDYRGLKKETDELIKDSPEVIFELLELLEKRKIQFDWKRKQLKDQFLSNLFKLEEREQINQSYKIVRKYSEEINIKEIADKLCFFNSKKSLMKEVFKTRNDKNLAIFNCLIINGMLLRGKDLSKEEIQIVEQIETDFDFNWVGWSLDNIEKKLPLRSYTINGGSYLISFGLQSMNKLPYYFSNFKNIKLNKNNSKELNDLSCSISKNLIQLVEIGNYVYSELEVNNVMAGIICHLDNIENSSESTQIAFKEIRNKEVFDYLFNMSVIGGAYGKGEYSATSRINTWKVLSGLTQKNYFEVTKNEVLTEFNNYKWSEFSCDNHWFIDEWLDLGIIGINEIEKKYAILVITDTD